MTIAACHGTMQSMPSWNAIRGKKLPAALLLATISILLYSGTLANPLILDSQDVIVKDPSIRALTNIPAFFSERSLPSPEVNNNVEVLPYYRPLIKTVYAFMYSLFGETAFFHHLLNVLLNTALVVLFYALLVSMSGDFRLAFAGALLYATNPARSVGICWVYGLSEILLALLVLSCLFFYHRKQYFLALILFLPALFCRETAVLFPVVLLFYELLLGTNGLRNKGLRVLPYFLLTFAFLYLRNMMLGSSPPFTQIRGMTLFNTIAVIIKRYLKIMLWPDASIAFYKLELFPSFNFEVILSYIVLLISGVLLVYFWTTKKQLAFWWIWVFLWISIWLNVGQLGYFLMGEKGAFLAAAGFCVVLADVLLRNRTGLIAIALIASAQFVMITVRTTYWKSPVVFLEAAVRFDPEFPALRSYLGRAYMESGNMDRAETIFRAVLNDTPGDVVARYNTALLISRRGDYARAAQEFERVLKDAPHHSWAWNNLGNCYYVMGNGIKATECWLRALAEDKRNPEAAYNLGMMAEQNGKLNEAIRYYEQYLSYETHPPAEVVQQLQALKKVHLRQEKDGMKEPDNGKTTTP